MVFGREKCPGSSFQGYRLADLRVLIKGSVFQGS